MTKFILSAFVISSALAMPVRSVEANPQVSPEACSRSCSAGCVEYAQNLQSTGQAILTSCGLVPPPPPPVGPNRPPPPRHQQVELFEDDRCKDELVAVLKEWTDCSQFSNPDTRVWGVRVDGVCYNVKDTTLGTACVAFSDFGSRRAVEFYHNDRCERDMLASVASKARCRELAKNSKDPFGEVWAVRINGVCQNVDDMPLAEACERYVP